MKIHTARALILVLFVVCALAAQGPGAAEPMSRTEFVTLVNEKMPVADIVAQVQARGLAFEIDSELEAALLKVEGGGELLSGLRAPATLELSVGVPGAEIFVDNEPRPPASAEGAAVVPKLSPGNHLVRVQAERYVGERLQVFLKPGETKRVEVKLNPSVEVKPGLLGLEFNVRAGTQEDTLVASIENTPDAAQRAEKLQELMQRYAGNPLALLCYRMLQGAYLEQEKFDDALAAGAKLLEQDPGNFLARLRQAQAYLGKGDLESAFKSAGQARGLLEQARAATPPEGVAPESWAEQKQPVLESAKASFQGLAYNFYVTAFQVTDPRRKAAYLERFVELYPESDYRQSAMVNIALAYQQQGDLGKTLEWGNKALEGNPDEGSILMLVSDVLSDRGQELGRARQLASHLLELLENKPEAVRPAGMDEAQWSNWSQLWKGTAHSALGQVLMYEETATAPAGMSKTRQAIDEFTVANPLLKGQPQLYARNLFRLGFAQAKVGELTQAQDTLNEVISLGTPYTGPAQELLQRVAEGLQRRKK
jgi:tetratricopeptide (TPR) repeat protein